MLLEVKIAVTLEEELAQGKEEEGPSKVWVTLSFDQRVQCFCIVRIYQTFHL